jgi:NAD(P) transhydrogenase subunit alpha
MLIGVPLQTVPGETGVAVTPENATKRKAQGSTPRSQPGTRVAASAADEAYAARTTR